MTQGGDELDLLRQLRKSGKVRFVKSNIVYTSARRLKKGPFYNLLVSLLFYYFAAYYINKLFKKPLIGTAPAFRKASPTRSLSWYRSTLGAYGISVLMLVAAIIPIFRNGLIDIVYGIGGIALHTYRFVI
jgi:hypothetical protein